MPLPSSLVASSSILAVLREVPGLPDLAVVGGAVRDWLLGRPHPDLDLCVAGDPEPVARQLQQRFGGSWYVLDPVFDVIRYTSAAPATVDLARRQGESWQADLLRRDLTINAIALPLTEGGRPLVETALLDPTGGISDLEARCVRAASREALEADPVRLLRVFRFAATLAFQVEPQTRTWVGELAGGLSRSAAERIRDELCKLLAAPSASPHVADLARCGLLEAVIPELAWLRGTVSGGHFDGFVHRLETLRALDDLIAHLPEWVPGDQHAVRHYLAEALAAGRPVRALAALSSLIGDLDRFAPFPTVSAWPVIECIGRRLKLAVREVRWLQAARRGRDRFDELLAEGAGGAALYRYFRDADGAAMATALIALADYRAARDLTLGEADEGPWKAAKAVLAEQRRPTVTAPAAPLVRGDELMAALGLPAGPQVAKLLEAIAEARADGRIASSPQALKLAWRLADRDR